MAIQTAEEQAPVANFLDFKQKEFDWRFITYEKLSKQRWKNDDSPREETIHWIGTIDLSQINKDTTNCVIYPGMQIKKPDQYQVRHEDGCETEHRRDYSYNVREIKDFLLEIKKKRNKYLTVFIKETVDYRGMHNVWLLHNKNSDPKCRYGTPTKKPWFQLSAKEVLSWDVAKVEMDAKIKEVFLMANEPYYWLK